MSDEGRARKIWCCPGLRWGALWTRNFSADGRRSGATVDAVRRVGSFAGRKDRHKGSDRMWP